MKKLFLFFILFLTLNPTEAAMVKIEHRNQGVLISFYCKDNSKLVYWIEANKNRITPELVVNCNSVRPFNAKRGNYTLHTVSNNSGNILKQELQFSIPEHEGYVWESKESKAKKIATSLIVAASVILNIYLLWLRHSWKTF